MRARRALSPIVSVILLILVAVGATVILYSWLSGAASNNPAQTGSLYERIKVDAVSVSTKGNTVEIYISNIGKTNAKIVSAYIINATSGNTLCSNTALNSLISPGKTATITLESCDNISSETGIFIAKVVTSDGIEATYTFTK